MKKLYDTIPQRRTIINRAQLSDQLSALVSAADAPPPELLRRAATSLLKEALKAGRTEISARLNADALVGRQLAAATAFLTDQLVRAAYDFVTEKLYPVPNATTGERLTLCAVGGFGRGEMAPYSDVDILFLSPYKLTPWGEQVTETMLYFLWDMGLKVGHASRTVSEMVRFAREDLTICTAMLEARYLWGDLPLFEEARTAFYRDVVTGSEKKFLTEKLAERDARHKRMGDSRYVVEPNVKEGKGALRDLHTLFWIGKFIHRVYSPDLLVDKGLFTPPELQAFLKAESYLWTVRCHLHDLTRRAEERLTFDVQRELARRLGYKDRPGASAVERFMKHYFLVAKQVGDLTHIFLAHLSEEQTRSRLIWPPLLRRKPRKLNGFILDQGRLSTPHPLFFSEKPLRLIELFALADLHGLTIHPLAKRQAGQNARLIDATLRNDPEANALFLDILTSPRDPETILRQMNEADVFGRFIPDFGRIVAQMQFDMYHHYTVDEHTIRAIGLLAKIEKGELKDDHPLATVLIEKLLSRRVLYVATLLHDIAKGRGGDHSKLGAEVARELCPRLGLSEAETETVAWLVQHHLLMSATAFKRDLTDFKTILDFVDKVQSPERLRLLHLLTSVDIRAVGPGVWNGWKGQLLHDLHDGAEEVLMLGHKSKGRQDRIAAKQSLLATQMGWDDAALLAHTQRFFDAYWIAEPADVLYLNAQQMRAADAAGQKLSIASVTDVASGATLISVYVADHPGLFYRLAGAISLSGANIVGARVHTTRDGRALDNITLQTPEGAPFDEPARLERLKQNIAEALFGNIKLADRLAGKALPQLRTQAFTVAPNVLIDNKASNRYTVLEVNARDRPALLYALTDTLFQARMTIHSAHIATYGERAVDVFYITDLTGDKITHASRLKSLERRLYAVLRGEETP